MPRAIRLASVSGLRARLRGSQSAAGCLVARTENPFTHGYDLQIEKTIAQAPNATLVYLYRDCQLLLEIHVQLHGYTYQT